ncbi:MAG TPA: ATP-binding protein [Acidobacteriaceae bacterium]|nr:ATP-binding protein [Acidobacteriaceae bacterium]
MRNAFQTRILAVALALATLGVCVLAGFNFGQDLSIDFPTDGVTWMETQGGLRADRVAPGSPGSKAGLRAGDVLEAVNGAPTPRLAAQVRAIYENGIYEHAATYSIVRPMVQPNGMKAAVPFPVKVYLEAADRSTDQGSRLIALVYLGIGLYVLFRRWTAPKSTHFFVFCLVSFVLYAFRSTGQPGLFDRVIYWGNLLATMLQPALFLHFAVSFSGSTLEGEGRIPARVRRRVIAPLLYLPGAWLVGLQVWAISFWSATGALSHRLDQIDYGYMALYYVAAAIVFYARYERAESGLERQQLKWLTRGTLLAVCPFTLLYALPFILGIPVNPWVSKGVLLSLVLLPLTFSWAIVRYRLMDVDLIFKRGVTYTLATASLAGIYFGAVGIASELIHTRYPGFGVWGPIVAIIVVGLSFDPLKRMIQGRVDRVFDQKSFDYRETLIDFGRSLNSQTDLRALLDAIVERLPQTLLVTRVAVFLATEDSEDGEAAMRSGFELAASHGLSDVGAGDLRTLDVRFLDFDGYDANDHIFLENPQQVLRLPKTQQESAGLLDLNYYLPCRVANREGGGTRTVAIIGVGRTDDGDFLSSEDVEVLGSLAGYIGIAIQNAQLYRRLEQKITEFERLKEFHENIVESIHIGIFAVDLEDKIESWNAQMEVMYAKSRGEALRQRLGTIFPAEFMERFDSVREEQGTHTFYKVRLTLPAGEMRVANIAIAPLLKRDFTVVGRIILVDDITERIALETQLTQAEKLSSIGLLAAGVAHEVNTPLAVISSYTQMLAKQMRPLMDADAKIGPVLEKITQQTFRASQIVNGLLNFSRTGSAEFASVDMNRLLEDTLALLDHQLKVAGIRVETQLDRELSRVDGNEGKLQQVVLNLLLNARDAMHGTHEARIRIATEEADGCVYVVVQDFGGGIEVEHLNRIFDPFFTTKTKPGLGQHKGTGLGLAVSYGIMQEHGGKMLVQSEVGMGTTFRLEFPIPVRSAANGVGNGVAGESMHDIGKTVVA